MCTRFRLGNPIFRSMYSSIHIEVSIQETNRGRGSALHLPMGIVVIRCYSEIVKDVKIITTGHKFNANSLSSKMSNTLVNQGLYCGRFFKLGVTQGLSLQFGKSECGSDSLQLKKFLEDYSEPKLLWRNWERTALRGNDAEKHGKLKLN